MKIFGPFLLAVLLASVVGFSTAHAAALKPPKGTVTTTTNVCVVYDGNVQEVVSPHKVSWGQDKKSKLYFIRFDSEPWVEGVKTLDFRPLGCSATIVNDVCVVLTQDGLGLGGYDVYPPHFFAYFADTSGYFVRFDWSTWFHVDTIVFAQHGCVGLL